MTNEELKQIKLYVLEELSKIYTSTSMNLWLKPMRVVSIEGTNVTVSFPQSKKSFIESTYYDAIKSKFSEVIGVQIELKIISDEEEAELNARDIHLQSWLEDYLQSADIETLQTIYLDYLGFDECVFDMEQDAYCVVIPDEIVKMAKLS